MAEANQSADWSCLDISANVLTWNFGYYNLMMQFNDVYTIGNLYSPLEKYHILHMQHIQQWKYHIVEQYDYSTAHIVV